METTMTISVSEDLTSGKRSQTRFCATLDGDSNLDRAGFGSSERSALWELARQLGIHPATLAVRATIARTAVR